ncbi:MAG: von Willebrand factor type domain protein [Hyphomicrobiales bacterium]|nr:von Willebrand factor type domain protein [Hyphomicrobiales bacterium]
MPRHLSALVLGLLIALSGTASSRAEPVDLNLALAVDASGSVDQRRFELQKRGYAAAFRNPRVWRAIHSGMIGAIAVTMYQWTGPRLQSEAVGWMIVRDQDSAEAFAAAIEAAPRRLFGGGTSISGAIDRGVALMASAPNEPTRRVIDVSGDGANTSGREASTARDEAVKKGIVINGLPILSVEPFLDRHYEEEVIGGEGAFMIAVRDYDAFGDAILRKLIAEIASLE